MTINLENTAEYALTGDFNGDGILDLVQIEDKDINGVYSTEYIAEL
ncbi:MAG: hypothetical protein OCD01_10235 [Fibrobacterales bacterium]